MVRTLLYVFIFLLVTSSCTSKRGVLPNVAYRYNTGWFNIHPEYVPYRSSDSTICLFVRFKVNELVKPRDSASSKSVLLLLQFRFFDLVTGQLLDSTSSRLVFHVTDNPPEIVKPLSLRLPRIDNVGLEVICKNSKGTTASKVFLQIDANKATYLLRYVGNDILFKNTISVGDSLLVESMTDTSPLWVSVFDTIRKPTRLVTNVGATPKYTGKPDTSFIVTPNSGGNKVCFKRRGLYRFAPIGTDSSKGFTIYCTDTVSFSFKSTRSMLEPLVYIENTYPVDSLLSNARNTKLEVDKFWLKRTSLNVEKSRELIRVFYNRAVLANSFFTTDKEGWKTDRGHLFVLVGQPSTVRFKDGKEIWTYENSDEEPVVSFSFDEYGQLVRLEHHRKKEKADLENVVRDIESTWQKGSIFAF